MRPARPRPPRQSKSRPVSGKQRVSSEEAPVSSSPGCLPAAPGLVTCRAKSFTNAAGLVRPSAGPRRRRFPAPMKRGRAPGRRELPSCASHAPASPSREVILTGKQWRGRVFGRVFLRGTRDAGVAVLLGFFYFIFFGSFSFYRHQGVRRPGGGERILLYLPKEVKQG